MSGRKSGWSARVANGKDAKDEPSGSCIEPSITESPERTDRAPSRRSRARAARRSTPYGTRADRTPQQHPRRWRSSARSALPNRVECLKHGFDTRTPDKSRVLPCSVRRQPARLWETLHGGEGRDQGVGLGAIAVASGCTLRSSVTRFRSERGQFTRAREAGVRKTSTPVCGGVWFDRMSAGAVT